MSIGIVTRKQTDRYSRRLFLKQVGVGAALVPLISAESAPAAAAGSPLRVITIAWTNGVAQPNFWPAGDDPTDSDILKPLAPFKSKVLIPAGLDYKIMLDGNHRYDGHFSYPSMFTGTYKNLGGQKATATGPSLDQVVSDFYAKQVALSVPLMNVSANGNPTSFRAEAQPNTSESDPMRLHSRLFAGKNLSNDQLQKFIARRKSVLDYLGKDLGAYGARLGTEDRKKIAAHADSIRQLETQLSAGGAAGGSAAAAKSCMAPTAPAAGAGYDKKVGLFNEMAAMAIRCDVTRAVSMIWGADGGSGPLSFPHIGIAGDYHGIAHQGAAGYENKIKIDTWLFQQVANLAKMLEDTVEPGGTALDNSIIVTANDMNEGSGHNVGSIPFVLVGGGGGYLKTGRVVKLGAWANKTGAYYKGDGGVAHNKLLATIANAVGIPGERFGDPAYPGVLPELKK